MFGFGNASRSVILFSVKTFYVKWKSVHCKQLMFLLQFLQSRDLHCDTLCLTLVQFQNLAFLCIILRLATDYPVFGAVEALVFFRIEVHASIGFYFDFNPLLFRPKSSFSFSFSFFHGRCLRSSVFLLASFSLKGFLSTYFRKFSTSSSSLHSSQSIILLNE